MKIFNKIYSAIIFCSQLLDKRFYLLVFLIIPPLFLIRGGHQFEGDFALYINEAIHLIKGKLNDLYEMNKFMMDQHQSDIMPYGPYLYPLGFPYLLIPVVYFFGINLLVIKLYLVVFWVLGMIFLKKNLTLLFPKEKNVVNISILLTLMSYPMLAFIDKIYADLSFFCFFNLWLYYTLNKKFQNNIFHLIINGCILFLPT